MAAIDTGRMTTEAQRPVVELAALVASAGGLEALSTVLWGLPDELALTIVVQQHLGVHNSALPTILRRDTAHPVDWAHDGQLLPPGQVVVCPPATYMEVTPHRCCRLRDMDDLGEHRFDVLLRSMACGYGPRSVAVVLSGSGRDGAAGTVAMRRSGAIVIAESPDTAQYRSMPIAAARAGADLVLPSHAIATALAAIVAGAPLPGPQIRRPGGVVAPRPTGNVAGAPRDRLPKAWLSNASSGAVARGESARLRAEELSRRRRDLSDGFRATAQTVAMARQRVEESRRRAQRAHQAAEEAAARWGD